MDMVMVDMVEMMFMATITRYCTINLVHHKDCGKLFVALCGEKEKAHFSGGKVIELTKYFSFHKIFFQLVYL